jgi:prepilin-type N-terminal cleavage/methylation domain-containing protein
VNGVRSTAAGITLLEMLVVLAIVALMAGLSLPAVWAAIDSLRLSQASQELVSLFNDGLNRAERSQQVVAVTISKSERAAWLDSSGSSAQKKLVLPVGISIARVLPEAPGQEEDTPRQFVFYPGGITPRVGIEIVNTRNVHRLVRVDPITGVPQVEEPAQP